MKFWPPGGRKDVDMQPSIHTTALPSIIHYLYLKKPDSLNSMFLVWHNKNLCMKYVFVKIWKNYDMNIDKVTDNKTFKFWCVS